MGKTKWHHVAHYDEDQRDGREREIPCPSKEALEMKFFMDDITFSSSR